MKTPILRIAAGIVLVGGVCSGGCASAPICDGGSLAPKNEKAKTVVKDAETSHVSLSPRLLALLDSPAHAPSKEKKLPAMPEGGLSDFAIDQFRKRIAEFEFPLPAGTVFQLFPYELNCEGIFNGDAFGEPNGYLGSAVTWYSLSPKYILYLKQSNYSSPKQGMVTVDDEAEIMTKEEAERRWPYEGEKKPASRVPEQRATPSPAVTESGIEVPLPEHTPCDASPKLRAKYLWGYFVGYQQGLTGLYYTCDLPASAHPEEARAFIDGNRDGQDAGTLVYFTKHPPTD